MSAATVDVREPEVLPGCSRSDLLRSVEFLFVSSDREDQTALRRMFPLTDRVAEARTCRDGLESARRYRFPVVLCDDHLPDGTWLDIFNSIAASVDPPLLIVSSRVADAHLWAEVLNLGGFDVLAKPFRTPEVRHVVGAAFRHRSNAVRQSPSFRTAQTSAAYCPGAR